MSYYSTQCWDSNFLISKICMTLQMSWKKIKIHSNDGTHRVVFEYAKVEMVTYSKHVIVQCSFSVECLALNFFIETVKFFTKVKDLQTFFYVIQQSNHRLTVMWQLRNPYHFRHTVLRRVSLIHHSYIKPRIEYAANNVTWSILIVTLRFITGSWGSRLWQWCIILLNDCVTIT